MATVPGHAPLTPHCPQYLLVGRAVPCRAARGVCTSVAEPLQEALTQQQGGRGGTAVR